MRCAGEGAGDANPLVDSVTIMDTTTSHTSTLRFVSTDLATQAAFGTIDVPVSSAP